MSESKPSSDRFYCHHKYLGEREKAIAEGEDEFIALAEFEAELIEELKRIQSSL